MYGKSKLLRTCSDLLKTVLKNCRTLENEVIVQRRSATLKAFDAVAFLAIPVTPYVRKPIRNCVWAVLIDLTNDVFPTHIFVENLWRVVQLSRILVEIS